MAYSAGERVGAVDEGVDAGGVCVEDHAGVSVHGGVVGLRAGSEAEAAHELVLFQSAVADGLGPASAAAQAVVLHVPETVLGGDEALGEESVVLVFSLNVGDAEVVTVDLDLALQSVKLQGAGEDGDCGRQLGGTDFAHAYHAVHLGSDFRGMIAREEKSVTRPDQ